MRRAGSAVLGTSLIAANSVAGRPSEETLEEKLMRLLRKGKKKQAHSLWESHGLAYHSNTEHFSAKRKAKKSNNNASGGQGGDDVSTDKRFGNPENRDDSTISIASYEKSGDDGRYLLVFDWDLASGLGGVDCHGPVDGAAISFSDDIFRNVSGTGRVGSTVLEADEKKTQFGYYAKLKTGNKVAHATPEKDLIQCEVDTRDHMEGADATIYGEFIHTWDPFCAPSNWSVSWGLPGAGQFNVNITGGANSWAADTNTSFTTSP